MRKSYFVFVLLGMSVSLSSQQRLTNDAILKLVNSGLTDDQVISIIGSQQGDYDVSSQGQLVLLKTGASPRVVSALIAKSSLSLTNAALPPPTQSPEAVAAKPTTLFVDNAPAPRSTGGERTAFIESGTKPRVFISAASKGPNRNAARDQSMEMGRDLEKNCLGIRVTINSQMADYTILLNHIEAGFVRDNQIQVANRDGDLISRTKEGGSINGGSKKACEFILADWSKH